MKNIYLDESGNTGAALLNAQQPTFVLSSNNFSDEEASQLIECARSPQGIEIKFSSLKKSASGRRRIVEFLNQKLINRDRIKTTVFHKKFMTLTKVVDLLVENVAYATGMDLYKSGLNIAMSNMHYYCMPAFCGEENFNKLLESFVTMIREQTPESVNAFYESAHDLFDSSTNEEYKTTLAPILVSREMVNEILESNNYLSLDPAIPSLFNHCTAWGEHFKEEFTVVHDVSKPIRAQLDVFNACMNKEIPYQEVGYDRRKFTFPLRANEISLEDSKNYHQIQIADLVASATAYVFNAYANDSHDEFSNSLRKGGIEKLMINIIWPTPEVTPKELGTSGVVDGINHVDFITNHLNRR